MQCVQDEWQNLVGMVKMLAAHLGPQAEVVLHDLTADYNHSIVAIENGHVTGRVVGGSGSNLGLPILSGQETEGDRYNYFTRTKDGRLLRSSSIYFRDPRGRVIGSLCINCDLSEFVRLDKALQDMVMYPPSESSGPEEFFAGDVGEILDYLTAQCRQYIGRPSEEMTREDKIKAVEFFDRRGAFLINKAGEHIRKFLGISKYTLYNYLELSREQKK